LAGNGQSHGRREFGDVFGDEVHIRKSAGWRINPGLPGGLAKKERVVSLSTPGWRPKRKKMAY
jgi:hypothetical protein